MAAPRLTRPLTLAGIRQWATDVVRYFDTTDKPGLSAWMLDASIAFDAHQGPITLHGEPYDLRLPIVEPEDGTIEIAGGQCLRTLTEFERGAINAIAREQRKANPDTWLIAFLADAVRLKREYLEARDSFGRQLAEEHARTAAIQDAVEGADYRDLLEKLLRALENTNLDLSRRGGESRATALHLLRNARGEPAARVIRDAQRAIFGGPQLLDARAHAGDGESAAREAGAGTPDGR